MVTLDRNLLEQVVTGCQGRTTELAQALASLFGPSLTVQVETHHAVNHEELAQRPPTAGIISVLPVGGQSALFVLPDVSGNLKEAYERQITDRESYARELTNRFAEILFPESLRSRGGGTVYVPDVVAAIRSAQLQSEAARIEFPWQAEDRSGTFELLWAAQQADALLASDDARQSPVQKPISHPASHDTSSDGDGKRGASSAAISYADIDDGLAHLPCYSRSLLKIKVPVMVTLAESRQPVENVLNIGPGSIIHFNKPCEDTLTLEVAGQKIAVGEAVKVGDKFGLWITSMILPEERFWVLSSRSSPERAK